MNKNNIIESQSRNESSHETLEIGILGSGLMGHGIAFVSAFYKHNVIMLDKSKKKAEMGLDNIKKILSKDVKSGSYDVQKSKKNI